MSKIIRWGALILIVGALATLVIMNIVKTSEPEPEQIWNTGTTLGETEDYEHHYILYTDVSCGYCYRLASILINYSEEFQKFLKDNKVLFEFRVIPYLGSDLSSWGAEAVACAADEGRFWDYYSALMTALGVDHFEPSEEEVNVNNTEYFLNVGRKLAMPESFNSCLSGHQKREAVRETGDKAARKMGNASGVPYVKFGKYASGGFDQAWGWNKTLQMLESGL